MALSPDAVLAHAGEVWQRDIVPALSDYIRIPNVSPAFDARWSEHGYMAKAVELVSSWCKARPIPGMTCFVHELEGRSPLLFIDIPASDPSLAGDTILLYGHLDKQPEMTGWREGLGPWEPVREGTRLYGRGGADDGYAAFASLTAVEALLAGGGAHARCVVLIEASEESGSVDLPAHVDALASRIGTPSLVICLDSGCADYDRLWVTTSLRGMVSARVTAEVLSEGVHSGDASGVVPSSFRVLRQILDRIEDAATGRVLLAEPWVDIPADRAGEARRAATALGEPISAKFPFVAGTQPMTADQVEQLLNRTWRPALSYVGADGLPPSSRAGNVLRPSTSLLLSLRLPPAADPEAALAELASALAADPPSGARVTVDTMHAAPGWNAPTFAPWLWQALDDSSTARFGTGAVAYGEGGTIPFMGMLGERFPEAQFVITGVLGPESNAHGPNEFIDIAYATRITAVVADIVDAHAKRC
ncbi:MAG TPA: M20/M25/M40 family metallo-hydrolase [Acidimicrobiales bacterium]